MEAILDFVNSSGFALFAQGDNWKCLVMLFIACGLLYLGIVKKFEPLLLVPIAFGMLITNLPGVGMYHEIFFAGGQPPGDRRRRLRRHRGGAGHRHHRHPHLVHEKTVRGKKERIL